MKFRKDHGIRIGDTLHYEGQTEREMKGTVIGVYPHFILLQSEAGYVTSVSNAELHTLYGWE